MISTFLEKHKTHLKVFESLHETVEFTKTVPCYSKDPLNSHAKRDDSGLQSEHNWIFGRYSSIQANNWEDVYKLVDTTWKEGLDTLEKLRKQFTDAKIDIPRPTVLKKTKVWNDDSGDEFSRERMLNGESYWCKTEKRKTGFKLVKQIVFNITAHSGISTEAIMWRGLAALVLADMWEEAGYRVEIVGYEQADYVYSNGQKDCIIFKIKDADYPLNLASLVAAVSGWFFRTIVFATKYLKDLSVVGSLGGPIHGKENLLPIAGEYIDKDCTYIDKVFDLNSAASLIKGAIAEGENA